MITINLFLDTNAIIAYLFFWDNLKGLSESIFSKKKEKYFSPTVEGEVEKIFKKKLNEFKKFMFKLYRRIQKYKEDEFISLSTIHCIIDNFRRIGKLTRENMHLIIDEIWESYGFSENQEVRKLLETIETFKGDFLNELFDKKKTTLKSLHKIPIHKNKDQIILEIIKEENLRKILHEKDEDILFDLNEYAKEHPELDLCLVSWDNNFIKSVKILLNQLSFKKYIGRYAYNTKI